MNYDNDRYTDEEEENELWDDDLDISAGEPETLFDTHASESEEEERDRYYNTHPEDDSPDFYSEPEHSAPANETGRKSFFANKKADEDFDNDFYDSDSEPVKKKQTEPKPDPEDPDYWIDETESPLSGIIPAPRSRWKLWLSIAGFILVAIVGVWIWFLRPYTDSAVKYGYIKNMEHRGTIIKTFEGTMIPYKEIGDPDPLYFTEFPFSVAGDSVAAKMKRLMLKQVPVRVEYEVYHSPLPWKGEQKTIIVKADSAETRSILPPEYRYNEE